MRIAVGRVLGMLAEPEPAEGQLVSVVGYYRPGQRLSSAATVDRVAAAQRGAVALATGMAIVRGFEQAWRESWALTRSARQARVVRTRHGDRVLVTELLCTRVLELAVHGLDLAAGLGRQPWMTAGLALGCVQPLLACRSGEGEDLARDKSDPKDAVLIARLAGELRCYEPERARARPGRGRAIWGTPQIS